MPVLPNTDAKRSVILSLVLLSSRDAGKIYRDDDRVKQSICREVVLSVLVFARREFLHES